MRSKKTIAIELGNRCTEYGKIANPSRVDTYQFAVDITQLGVELKAAIAADKQINLER